MTGIIEISVANLGFTTMASSKKVSASDCSGHIAVCGSRSLLLLLLLLLLLYDADVVLK